MREFFCNKVILVTGAAGSVGQELVHQLLSVNPAEVRAVDNNETELFFLGERYRESSNLSVYLGDVRDTMKVENLCAGVDIVFHAAAFKHVGLSEYNPFDAIQTNILGVKNVIQGSLRQGVKRVLFTSSDKAVNPTNVMGTTKLMGERLFTAANLVNGRNRQRFSSVRFGNVIGSRGSVVPIFAEQIRRGGPVTITDADMTRFFMTMEDSVQLVIEGCALSCGGEVFVTKMPVMRILDLARAMIGILAPAYGYDPEEIPFQFVGIRSGEKLYEELLTTEEITRAREIKTMFVVLPSLKNLYGNIQYTYKGQVEQASLNRQYISSQEPPMTVPEIQHFLLVSRILDDLVLEDRKDDLGQQKPQRLRLVAESQVGLA